MELLHQAAIQAPPNLNKEEEEEKVKAIIENPDKKSIQVIKEKTRKEAIEENLTEIKNKTKNKRAAEDKNHEAKEITKKIGTEVDQETTKRKTDDEAKASSSI